MIHILLFILILNSSESFRKEKDPTSLLDKTPVYDRYLGGVFVKKAFRVSDGEIRLLFLKDTFRNVKLWHKLSGKWEKAGYDHLIPGIVDQCYFRGYIAHIHVPRSLHQLSIATVRMAIAPSAANASDLASVDVEVIDRRPSPTYEHSLGVMLQPVYFAVDWTIFVQYFESWIASGVTKFYVFLHSYTQNVKNVIDFYQSKLGENLTVIAWGDVPTLNDFDFLKDPNTRTFLAESVTAINYCVYLARYTVKYLAIYDLDDFPYSEKPLLDILEEYDRNGNYSHFLFNWKITLHQPSSKVSSISDISFSHLNSFFIPSIEDVNEQYSGEVNKKYFCRPERVRHATVHRISLAQRNVNGEFFGAVDIDEIDGKVLHLKPYKFSRPLPTPTSEGLTGLVEIMVNNLQERIVNETINDTDFGDWFNASPAGLGPLFYNYFPKRIDSSNLPFAMCRSVKTLVRNLPQPELFVRPNNEWINLNNPEDKETCKYVNC